MHIFLPILPRHVWENVDPKEAQTSYVNEPPIVGTGPFITTEFKKGSHVKMERNPYYWGTTPTLDELLFEYYTNGDTMTADLKSGTIDAAWGIPEAQFDSLASVDGIEPVAYNFFNWDYLSLNCYEGKSLGNPVLRDWRFRNALNYAVDRQALCDIAYVKKSAPGTTILPPGMWTDPDYHWEPPADQLYTFDLAKAGQLLDEAGYELGPDGLRLVPRQAHRAAPVDDDRVGARADEPQARRRLVQEARPQDRGVGARHRVRCRTASGTSRATRTSPTSTCTSGTGRATATPARRSPPTSPRRSATPTSPAGRTPSTTRSTTSRRRRWTPSQRKVIIDRHAADHVRADALGGAHLSAVPAGLQRRRLDRLGAHVRRRRAGVPDHRLHAVLHRPRAGGLAGFERRLQRVDRWWRPRPPSWRSSSSSGWSGAGGCGPRRPERAA